FLPGRTRNVAADDTLYGKHFSTLDEHGASAELVGILADSRRILVHVDGDEVVGNDVGQVIEPEQGNLAQDASLVGDARGQDVVESRNAVGGDEKQLLVANGIDVTDLAAGVKVEIREVSLQEDGV